MPDISELSAPDFAPMAVDDFLSRAELYLKRSDVVLCRGKSTFSKLIRFATKSQFSHAALVFLVPHRDLGFNNTFLIESVPTGVDVTDLRHYIKDHPDKYDVVIKRLTKPWFVDNAPKIVRGSMLDFIKADYDFRAIWQITKSIAKKMLFGFLVWRDGLEVRLAKTYDEAKPKAERKPQPAPGQFICSGFVQYGFLGGTRTLLDTAPGCGAVLDDVMFAENVSPDAPYSKILSTTPEDLAATPKLEWCYVIRQGMVYRVHSTAEANALLDTAL